MPPSRPRQTGEKGAGLEYEISDYLATDLEDTVRGVLLVLTCG